MLWKCVGGDPHHAPCTHLRESVEREVLVVRERESERDDQDREREREGVEEDRDPLRADLDDAPEAEVWCRCCTAAAVAGGSAAAGAAGMLCGPGLAAAGLLEAGPSLWEAEAGVGATFAGPAGSAGVALAPGDVAMPGWLPSLRTTSGLDLPLRLWGRLGDLGQAVLPGACRGNGGDG